MIDRLHIATCLALVAVFATFRVDAQVSLVADINSAEQAGSRPVALTAAGGQVLLIADDGVHGRELWRTDGTRAGTRLVADLRPGRPSAFSEAFLPGQPPLLRGELAALGDAIVAIDSSAIWITDGTEAGTQLLRTFATRSSFEPASALPTTVAALVYFVPYESPTGRDLWVTDGTAAGTRLVFDGGYGDQTSQFDPNALSNLTPVGDMVWFASRDTTQFDIELWRSDGTAAGTEMVADIVSEGGSGAGRGGIVPMTGSPLVLFTAQTEAAGTEPWVTDGSAAGTRLLLDINPQPGPRPPGSTGSVSSAPRLLTAFAGGAVFFADDGVHGYEPWITDGTPGGTRLIADLHPGTEGSMPTVPQPPFSGNNRITPASAFVPLGARVVFAADDGAAGSELWSSDGTPVGTRLVTDINPGAADAAPTHLTRIGGRIVFSACDANGCEAWETDGSADGTRRLADIAAGAASSDPADFVALGDAVLFTADDAIHGREVWIARRDPRCIGDCDANGLVEISELVRGVGLALGGQTVAACAAFDFDGDGAVGIDTLIQAVGAALNGC